jgi:hypothetical protein
MNDKFFVKTLNASIKSLLVPNMDIKHDPSHYEKTFFEDVKEWDVGGCMLD